MIPFETSDGIKERKKNEHRIKDKGEQRDKKFN